MNDFYKKHFKTLFSLVFMPVLGCAFDAELPVNVEIACESDADCPADAQERFCELRLDRRVPLQGKPRCRTARITEASLGPNRAWWDNFVSYLYCE